jgi:hypothetical protein
MSEQYQNIEEKTNWKTPPHSKLDPILAGLAWAKVHISIHEEHEPDCFISKIRYRIGRILEDRFVQYILLFLLIVDIGLLFTDLSLEAFYQRKNKKNLTQQDKLPEWAHKAENVTHYATLVILCIFEVELLLLMFSYGFRFLLHPMVEFLHFLNF